MTFPVPEITSKLEKNGLYLVIQYARELLDSFLSFQEKALTDASFPKMVHCPIGHFLYFLQIIYMLTFKFYL